MIAIDVLHTKKEKIYLSYVSKHKSNREKHAIRLMIPNGERCYYIGIKQLPMAHRQGKYY